MYVGTGIGHILPGEFLAKAGKGAPYTSAYLVIEMFDGKRVHSMRRALNPSTELSERDRHLKGTDRGEMWRLNYPGRFSTGLFVFPQRLEQLLRRKIGGLARVDDTSIFSADTFRNLGQLRRDPDWNGEHSMTIRIEEVPRTDCEPEYLDRHAKVDEVREGVRYRDGLREYWEPQPPQTGNVSD